jgi:hypothetical protein
MANLAFFLFLLLSSPVSSWAFENHEAKEDAAAIQVDGFFGTQEQIGGITGDAPFSRIYGFSFFPLLTVAGNELVGSAEFSVMPRTFGDHGSALNGSLLQSYGLGLGYQIKHSEKRTAFAYGLMGINGDMRDIGTKALYGDLSYIQQYDFSKKLRVGGGFDIHFYFDDYYPYPLILLDWQVAEHTKVKINFDTGEIKQFLTENFSVSIGAQYDIFHYSFGREAGYSMETTSGILRMEYRLGKNIYARLSAKRPFWGIENIYSLSRNEKGRINNEGSAIRLQIAYGE